MDMKLLISKQRSGEKLVLDLNEDALRGLVHLIQAAIHMNTDVGGTREIPVSVLRGNAFARVNKANIYTEEEFARACAEEKVDLAKARPMQGRFFVDVRRQALVVLTFREETSPDGRVERVRDDMTLGLRESDLTILLGRALSRIDMSQRELRMAEQGGRDKRRGKAGREARQRVGQLKQERHNQQQRRAAEAAGEASGDATSE